MKKRIYVAALLIGLGIFAIKPADIRAAEPVSGDLRKVSLDLTENTLQFGGFPDVRDEEEVLDGIYADDTGADKGDETACLQDKEEALEDIHLKFDSAISGMTDSVDVAEYGLTQGAAVEIISDVLNDNPGYFYVTGVDALLDEDTGLVEAVEVDYASNSKEMNREYEEAVSALLAQIDPNWSDEEKLFFLHDYLVTNCQYDYETYKANLKGDYNYNNGIGYTPYGVLVLHSAVCQGYADTLTDLGKRLGIEVWTVSSGGINHAWNLVGLNGKKFYVDCTWDDPGAGEYDHWFESCCQHDNFLGSQAHFTATDHTSTDWVISSERNKSIYGLYTDTSYDQAPWKGSKYSPVVCEDAGITYYNSEDGYIYSYACDLSAPSRLMEFGNTWRTDYPGGYYIYTYDLGTLLKIGSGYFINNGYEVYSLDFDQGKKTIIFEIEHTTGSQEKIYGMVANGMKIRCDIGTDISDADKIRSEIIDLTTAITYIDLDKTTITFNGISGSETITATTNASEVVWSSTDTSVARVTDGVVTPVGYGSTKITASAGNVKASCRVNVDTTCQNDWEYDRGENVITIFDYKGTDKSVTVPKSFVIGGVTCTIAGFNINTAPSIESLAFESGLKPSFMSFPINVKNIDFTGLDTSDVTYMTSMFCSCSKLETLDLSTFNTKNAVDMKGMFYGCAALKKLDLSSFDLSNITDESSFTNMFYGCNALTEIETPKGLTVDVELPYKFKDEDGNIYDKLPKNETVSRHLIRSVPVEMTGVFFEEPEYEVAIGQTKQLEFKVEPAGADVETVTWKIGSGKFATIDQTGLVTGVKEGTTIVMVLVNGKFSTSTNIKVVEKVVPLEGLDISASDIKMDPGDSVTLTITKTPTDATEKITMRSSDESVARIDTTGTIEAVGPGEADITVSGGEFSKVCHVTVYKRLTEVSLDAKNKTLELEDTFTLKASVTPSDIAVSLTWSTDDGGKYITLVPSSDGKSATVTAVGEGKATVTVTATDRTRTNIVSRMASAVITVTGDETVTLDNGLSVVGLKDSYVYAGQPVVPDVTVYYNGVRLIEKREYTILCSNNKGPGRGLMTIKGTGNYTGKSQSVEYKIEKAVTGSVSIKKAKVEGINAYYSFTGEPIVPELTVTLNGMTLKEDEDYMVSYKNHIDVGPASVTVEGIGKYKDSIVKKFRIKSVPIAFADIEETTAPYSARGPKAMPVITYGNYTLKYGVDYKVTARGRYIGTGTMTVWGQGNFVNKTTESFTLSEGDLSKTVISVSDVKHKAGQKGSACMSKVKIYDIDGGILKAGKDYVLEYEDVTQNCVLDKTTGSGIVEEDDVIRVTAKPGPSGLYKGEVTAEYRVVSSVIPITKAKLIKIPNQEYTGDEIKPEVLFEGLTEGEDYEVVAYFNNIYKGSGKAIVRGIGDYSGTRIVGFKIAAKKL